MLVVSFVRPSPHLQLLDFPFELLLSRELGLRLFNSLQPSPGQTKRSLLIIPFHWESTPSFTANIPRQYPRKMMRQADDPDDELNQFQSGHATFNSYSPSIDERVAELVKQGKNKALIDLRSMKELARRCFESKDNIINDMKSVDPNDSTDLLTKGNQIFGCWQSKNKIKDIAKPVIARHLVQLMDIVAIIDDHLTEKDGTSVSRNTRNGSQQREANLSPKQKLYQDIMALRNKVDLRIRTTLNDGGANIANILKGLKIDPQMVGRQFDSNRVPADCSLQACAFCLCTSVITH